MNCTGSEKSLSVLGNLPYDFGKKVGRKFGRRGKRQLVQVRQEMKKLRVSKAESVMTYVCIVVIVE